MLPNWKTFTSTVIGLLLLFAGTAQAERDGSAFFKSLLIPGWGQYSLGHRNTALVFLGSDLIMIGGMLGLRAYGVSARDDYKAIAAVHAGVTGDHDHDFYVDVGNWMTVDDFNERRLQNREYNDLYTSQDDFWAWDSNANRQWMEDTRVRSDRAFNSIIYFAGGLVLNRIVSAIHAGRLDSQQSQSQEPETNRIKKETGWQVDLNPVPAAEGFLLRVTHNF